MGSASLGATRSTMVLAYKSKLNRILPKMVGSCKEIEMHNHCPRADFLHFTGTPSCDASLRHTAAKARNDAAIDHETAYLRAREEANSSKSHAGGHTSQPVHNGQGWRKGTGTDMI